MLKYLKRAIVKNKQGFTMIEAMMIAGLLAVMVTTFASYQYQRARQNKVQEMKKDYSQLQDNVKTTANQSEAVSQAEDLQFAELGTPAPTAAAAPTGTPDAMPAPCPAGCINTSGTCTIDASCVTTGVCPDGCTLTGTFASTTTAGTTTGATTGGTTGATTSSTPIPTATPKPPLCAMSSTPQSLSDCCPYAPYLCGSGTQCDLVVCPSGQLCSCSATLIRGGGSCTSTTTVCESTAYQCVYSTPTFTCADRRTGQPVTYSGKKDCACPGVYMYKQGMCGGLVCPL
jgi:type II secretory pathway pseudopilin PulG